MKRDCNHPDFPLTRYQHAGGDYWRGCIPGNRRAFHFGSCKDDPTGETAWRLFEYEKAAREAGIDPRAINPRRNAYARAWLLSAPLSKAGIAVMDPAIFRVVCTRCAAVWRIYFRPTWHISPKYLRCPYGCTPAAPVDEVRKLILQAILPDTVSMRTYHRIVAAKRSGWVAMPHDVDQQAEAEGRALAMFMQQFFIKQPQRRRTRMQDRRGIAASQRAREESCVA